MLIRHLLLQYSPITKSSNCLARVVKPTDSATMSRSLLASLHWLPICQRVTFKLAGLVYSSLHETSPTYLSSVLHAYTPTRSLRSSSAHLFVEPRLITTLASRGFQSAGPRIWNSLPNHIKLALLVQIQTQNLPLYFNSLITGHLVNFPRLWFDVILDCARVTNVLHYITLQ